MIINEELIQGKPTQIIRHLQMEIANEILKMGANNYEDVCANMRMTADVFELLEEHINDECVTLKYNPMGAWYYVEKEEPRTCSECGKDMTEGYCIENGLEYYCSDECLHKHYTDDEYNELYDNGYGDSYYTEWECD